MPAFFTGDLILMLIDLNDILRIFFLKLSVIIAENKIYHKKDSFSKINEVSKRRTTRQDKTKQMFYATYNI